MSYPICGMVNLKEGRKEMFYLTTHSTHFIYGYMASDIIIVKDHSDSERGRNEVLFNDAHNTFSYGYMASDIL